MTPLLLDSLVADAAGIAWRVHDEDPADVWAELAGTDRLRLEQLACVLAAMVDVDRTPAQLLAWTEGEPVPVVCRCCATYRPKAGRRHVCLSPAALSARGADGACRGCGGLFVRDEPRQRYCSPGCSRDARRRTWRASKRRKARERTVHSAGTSRGPELAESA